MNMLQIIHVATIGGAEKHTRLIIKAFARRGFNITFLYPPGPYAAEYAALSRFGVECIEFDFKKNIVKSIRFIRAVLKQKRIDIIHSHMHGADFLAFIARLGLGIRHFSTIHNIPQDNPGLMFAARSTIMTFIAFHFMEKVFAVSAPAGERMRRELMLSRSKVVIALNGIDFEEMVPNPAAVESLRRSLKPSAGARILLCAGLFFHIKGQRYLIEALHIVRDAYPFLRLVLLGGGEDEEKLRAQAARLGLDGRVVFAGFHLNVADWLAAADIYAQPSLIDPMPRALLEAMYMGLPVIASDIVTLRQVVTDKHSGLLVPPRSPEAIARAVGFLLDNPAEARRMGAEAKRFAEVNCSIDTMAGIIIDSLGITSPKVRDKVEDKARA